ncbi:HTH domain-containing protein [Parapedobacter tibetensis]|uniref:HTH domain-containing protein n=1 Tax=Parapedobacter tibetensis TaxID=2972951 RepID=UPI00214DAD28|nr:HTH domain-containing protein [Parapedobacter tibetensis]
MTFQYQEQGNGFVTELAYTSQKIDTKEPRGTANGTVNGTVNVTERQDTIFDAVKKNKNITIEDLVLLTNVSRRTVTRDLDKLKRMGRIRRIGADKGGYWEVDE